MTDKATRNPLETQFPAIGPWHRRTGSFPYYIDAQLRKARDEGAPRLAVYHCPNHGWRTLDQVTNTLTQRWFERNHPDLVAEFDHQWPTDETEDF